MKRTRLRPVSAKRARQQRERRRNMIAAYGETPACVAQWPGVCRGWADDAHEPGMRARGADPTDPAQAIPVCRPCHDAIHANVAVATARGLLVPSWDNGPGDAA